ncbi:UNKNOWN [Stylonychia lemnae]|uniref:Uncharacterized protein n=1 Tax=Stylonychia lemnae TaxID=5949 RepID=A0A078A851_STYLE|nr:UNKNOWN [Stylonychia lemnae]|eukprot:CDW78046.1 UNKNOWN [Stylonychia lemnae]
MVIGNQSVIGGFSQVVSDQVKGQGIISSQGVFKECQVSSGAGTGTFSANKDGNPMFIPQ